MSTDSRTVEKLIALLRYEMSPEAAGCSSAETLHNLLDWVKDVVLNPETENDADMTAAETDRCHADALIVADHLLMALVACGRTEEAESFVDGTAKSRRECSARFKAPTHVPWASEEEREALSQSWGKGSKVAS